MILFAGLKGITQFPIIISITSEAEDVFVDLSWVSAVVLFETIFVMILLKNFCMCVPWSARLTTS
jgi:hypothetical protein